MMTNQLIVNIKRGMFFLLVLSVCASYLSFFNRNDFDLALGMAAVFSIVLLPFLLISHQLFYQQFNVITQKHAPIWFILIIIVVAIFAIIQILVNPTGNIHLTSSQSEINTVINSPEGVTDFAKNTAINELSMQPSPSTHSASIETATGYSTGIAELGALGRKELLKMILPLLSLPLLLVLATAYALKQYKGYRIFSWFIFICGWSVITGWIVAWIAQPNFYFIIFVAPLILYSLKAGKPDFPPNATS